MNIYFACTLIALHHRLLRISLRITEAAAVPQQAVRRVLQPYSKDAAQVQTYVS